eukprot:snap_masked-scaffold_32-processed-gene-1.21-mRNA-1 protein AED:0.04 eAED:0.04 QI:0/-1/0/1/-1/1/1/0/264
MKDWSKIKLKKTSLSEKEKSKLKNVIDRVLRNGLKGSDIDPDEMYVEYIHIMVINGKTVEECFKSLIDLLDEKYCKRICEYLATEISKFGTEDEKSVKSPRKSEMSEKRSSQSSERKSESSSSRRRSSHCEQKAAKSETEEEKRKRRAERFSTSKESNQSKDKSYRDKGFFSKKEKEKDEELIGAYRYYVERKYKAGFLDFQRYLKDLADAVLEKTDEKQGTEKVESPPQENKGKRKMDETMSPQFHAVKKVAKKNHTWVRQKS